MQIGIPSSIGRNRDIPICTRRILDPTKILVGSGIILEMSASMILGATDMNSLNIVFKWDLFYKKIEIVKKKSSKPLQKVNFCFQSF